MKKITVSVDEETHRLARIKVSELGTSVSALVRGYLRSQVSQPLDGNSINVRGLETEDSRRRKLLSEAVDVITLNGSGLRMSENRSRDEVYSDRPKGREVRFVDTNVLLGALCLEDMSSKQDYVVLRPSP